MSKEASEEMREAAVAVVSAAAKATELVRNESSDSCGLEDDKKQLLSGGKEPETFSDEKKFNGGIQFIKDEKYSNEMETSIKVFTLNCWGLKVVSKLRKERFSAIANYLCEHPGSGYDVVFLQEVWCNDDFEELKQKLTKSPELYPYCHYFDNGIIGSGTCIFSKVRLQDANYHEFAMNGYPTNFWHGDWFASKGIGVCQIRFNTNDYKNKIKSNYFDIHLYVSHYHANYDPSNDIYLGHRVIHAFESAQWIKLTSSAADLTIYAGDFNTDPYSLPYRILRNVANLKDAWECVNDDNTNDGRNYRGCTNEVPTNSFCSIPSSDNHTESDSLADSNGLRIDYIMFSAGPGVEVMTQSSSLPLPHRVPGKNYSFSDHEAVDACLKLIRNISYDNTTGQKIPQQTNRDFKRAQSIETRNDCVNSVNEAIKVMERSLQSVDRSQKKYAVYSLLSAIILIITFIPSGMTGLEIAERIILDICLFFPRLGLSASTIIFGLMGSLFSKRERNAFRAVKNQLNLVLEQDVDVQ